MSALGEEFRSAREARGLSLSDVAERLHIRSVYLAAIEDGDWKAVGAPVYVRGFMRTYARFLGLDAESAVERFAIDSGTGPVRADQPVPVSRSGGPRISAERNGPSLPLLATILVAVALLGFLGYQYWQYRTERTIAVMPPTPLPAATVLSTAAAAPSAVPTELPAAASAAPESSLASASPAPGGRETPAAAETTQRLDIFAKETAWMRVTVDGAVAYEGTMAAGTHKTFRGNVAVVRAGNAGGIALDVNGHAIPALGGAGDVVERRFTLSGK